MAHPDHDAIVDAFRRAEPNVKICNRGDPDTGYTHIHGPGKGPEGAHCYNHSVVIEKYNGTVAPCRNIAVQMGATERPCAPIGPNEPLGYSNRPQYGRFDYAFVASSKCQDHATLEAFVREVIRHAKDAKIW